ncbi:hypothetical protein Ddye_029724 [Dipteronia dyeriana]|uniref:Uncharacterized protein n=1 Tax=Dipteronia dyeriana TaxID=168575 RepID=A0AAD9TFN1_9ROSI|nr:hypothetical protein Ddye_029724 [Dipteronia dyeriana]
MHAFGPHTEFTPFWKQGFWRYHHLCTKLKCLAQDIVQQCRRNCKLFCNIDQSFHNETVNAGLEAALGGPSCSDVLKPDNVLSLELNGHLNVKGEPCGNIMGLMFHGCLTTAGLVGNILERLATHQEIQDKVSILYFHLFPWRIVCNLLKAHKLDPSLLYCLNSPAVNSQKFLCWVFI